MGLPWRASYRGLTLERGANNIGPMATSAIQALEAMDVCASDECAHAPAQVAAEDFTAADRVVALKRDEHLPLLQERSPVSSMLPCSATHIASFFVTVPIARMASSPHIILPGMK
jgi:hypothetical protein